jgi:hypothetical protein
VTGYFVEVIGSTGEWTQEKQDLVNEAVSGCIQHSGDSYDPDLHVVRVEWTGPYSVEAKLVPRGIIVAN